ncbi:MAG: hypothetical protein CMO80_12465 [Verrucomicrobiales bacterium]|nr:hypothetical protein [Verrucomicrobiales bacterium]
MWKRNKADKFTGRYSDSNGTKAKFELQLKYKKRFRRDSSGGQGLTSITTGQLGPNGELPSKTIMYAPDGKMFMAIDGLFSDREEKEDKRKSVPKKGA